MWGVTWLVVVGASLYLLASRLLPWLLSTFLSLYLGKTKLGCFGWCLEGFRLAFKLGGLKVRVDNLRVTFSIITSDASNLLTLITTGQEVILSPAYHVKITIKRPLGFCWLPILLDFSFERLVKENNILPDLKMMSLHQVSDDQAALCDRLRTGH